MRAATLVSARPAGLGRPAASTLTTVFNTGVGTEPRVWMRLMVTGEAPDCVWLSAAVKSVDLYCCFSLHMWKNSVFLFPAIKTFSAIFCQLRLSARIHGRLLRAGHRSLHGSPLLWARRLPGPAEQLHLPLPAWIRGAALSTGNKRVRQRPLCTWRDLRGPDQWLSVPLPPRFWR